MEKDRIKEKVTIEILWTGGFDSTFRVCQLYIDTGPFKIVLQAGKKLKN